MPKSLVFFCAALCLFFIPPDKADARAPLKAVTLVCLMNTFAPWTLTVEENGHVRWDNSSDGQLLADPKLETKSGTIPVAVQQELWALLEKNGYTEKKPVDGVEPKMRLVLLFDDGKSLVNLGPALHMEANAKAFAGIEAMFLGIAESIGKKAPGYYQSK